MSHNFAHVSHRLALSYHTINGLCKKHISRSLSIKYAATLHGREDRRSAALAFGLLMDELRQIITEK